MKAPLSWLKEFVDIAISAEELAHRLTMGGLEVAAIHSIGLEGSELPWDPDKILVANVLEVKPHPNADRLVLADVDYGDPTPHTVVTGAPNLFPYKGQGRLEHPLKAVFAMQGARLYDGHAEGKVITTLKGRPVRGVMSDAMLCSEKELGISDEHEGIIFLEDDAPVGQPLRDFLGEVVFEIDITPNNARCLSIIGLAREIAALTGAPLHLPDPQAQMDGPPVQGQVTVTIENPELCPRFTAALVEDITIGPSPHWMQRRLRHIGMRPVNNIVDISNYVMMEWGEPTHAFDADKVRDQHLIARVARPGERLTTLDGKERDLTPGPESGLAHFPLLVADPSGPLGVAGVMGGEDSEVRETTTRVLLEAAIWEPSQIRRTAQAFKLPSEASRRFERGVDYEIPLAAQRRALDLMRTLAGGVVYEGIIDVYPRPWQSVKLDLPPCEITRIVGIQLSAPQIADILRSAGFVCEIRGSSGLGDFSGYAIGCGNDSLLVHVTVPSFRQDVTLLADLCEEVARLHGYEYIPATQMTDEIPVADAHPDLVLEQRTRDILVGCGLNEVITPSLTSMEAVALTQPSEAVAARYLKLSNPISPEREYLRRSMLPTLLEALAANLRERDQALMFETGRVYLPQPEAGAHGEWLPDEPRRLGIAIAGPRTTLSWSEPSGESLDFFDLKGIVETLLERFGLDDQTAFVPLADDERFHPGRAATLLINRASPDADARAERAKRESGKGRAEILSEPVGVLGEIHPLVGERFDLEGVRVVVAEIDLDALIEAAQLPRYTPISRYPATVQDLAVVIADDVSADRVAAAIRRGAGDLLESLTLFDVYTGPQIGTGKRSLAYRLAFRASDRTLSDEAVAKVRTKIIKLLEREIGASIRS